MKFKDEDIIKLMNQVALFDMTNNEIFKPLETREDMISKMGLDSFDYVMWYLYIGEEFGIEQATFNEHLTREDLPVSRIIDFINDFYTIEVDFEESYKKYIKE